MFLVMITPVTYLPSSRSYQTSQLARRHRRLPLFSSPGEWLHQTLCIDEIERDQRLMCKAMGHRFTGYTYTQAHSGTRRVRLRHYQCLSMPVTIVNEAVFIVAQFAGRRDGRLCNNAGICASTVRGCMNEQAR